MMRRQVRINAEALLRTTALAGLLYLLVKLITSGELSLLVNPSRHWLVEWAGYVLLLLLAVQATGIFDNGKRGCGCDGSSGIWGHLPLILTLLLAFSLPFGSLDAKLVTAKGLNSRLAAESAYVLRDMPRPLARQLSGTEKITVTDRNFTEVISEVNLFPRDYIGKEISLTGFVFREEGYEPNQLAVARYVIVCCAADAAPYGLLCCLDNAGAYKEGDWLTIRGEIVMGRHQGRNVPLVRVKAAEQVAAPKNPYAYPFAE